MCLAYQSGTTTKPNQVHHYATNKSKTYTPQLEEIANRYGLDLDDAWNKDLLPHQQQWCLTLEKTNKQNKFFVKF